VSAPGEYALRWTLDNGVCPASSDDVILRFSEAPTIAEQPGSPTVCAGSDVSLTVRASGPGPLSYQWRKGNTAIAGAAAASYTITQAKLTDAGNYSVVVTGPCGSLTNAVATVSCGIRQ
jgi:hypothetical protein